MELQQLNMVGLEAFQGFIQLLCGRSFGAAIHRGHQEDLLAITVAQRFSDFDLSLAVSIVVIPGVVHVIDAAVNGSAHKCGQPVHRMRSVLYANHPLPAEIQFRRSYQNCGKACRPAVFPPAAAPRFPSRRTSVIEAANSAEFINSRRSM